MDWGTILIGFCLNLVFTVFLYLLVPTLIVLSKNKYDLKTVKRISIINSVVVWFLFRALQVAISGEVSAGASVFLWGAVSYWFLKKYCLKEEKTTNVVASKTDSNITRVTIARNIEPRAHGNYNVYGKDLEIQKEKPQHTPVPVAETKPVDATPKPQYCRRCGNKLTDDSIFCCQCGVKVENATSEDSTVEIKTEDKGSKTVGYQGKYSVTKASVINHVDITTSTKKT